MHLKAFTTTNCFYCDQLKELLKRIDPGDEEVKVDVVGVGKDISREYFKHEYPDAVGYPYVIVDGEPVGGLVETAKLLLQKGFVTSKKNG